MNIRKIIKEELLKEVGGYDDMSVMGQHVGASMDILSSSYQILMDTLAELANSLVKGEGRDKFKMSKNIVDDLSDVTQKVIEDTDHRAAEKHVAFQPVLQDDRLRSFNFITHF